VVKELVDASQDADVVVVGARSHHTAFTRLLVGSVTTDVVQDSASPVVIVPQAR
jgi:nucleotide-binding universal stress UspA family protein